MVDFKEFDKLLSATVTAPRLSGSKVQKLASLSSELVAEDHQLVTTFFKLNASLPPASQSRISSLYVFDAIARGAKSEVNKGIGTQVNKERGKGTQAGLLLKLEGVVDSWIEGLLDDGKGGVWTEGKDKTKKIVDIWSKAGTFPQHCLERLTRKITNAGPQAGPSSTPKMLESVGRSGSIGSASKGSTTPPYPPPQSTSTRSASIPAGGLPPEVAKLLGITRPLTSIPSPATNGIPLPVNGGTPNPVIPTIDLAAILASVNKPQLSPNTAPTQANASAQQPGAVVNIPIIPNLSNLASLLPTNVFPPPAANAPPQSHQARPASNPIPNPGLNATQSAALAKFASLAQAGPPAPPAGSFHPHYQQQHQGPPHAFLQGDQEVRRDEGGFIPRRSPQKGYNNLPSTLPEGMRAEPMRGSIPPAHRSSNDRGRGHGRRESNDRHNNDWERRGSFENDQNRGSEFPGGRGRGGGARRGGRDRSRSPNRGGQRGYERPSDNGWGNRNNRGGGNVNQLGRGGFSGGGGDQRSQEFDQNNNNRNNQFPSGPQIQHTNPPFQPNLGIQSTNGLPNNPTLSSNNGLPPRPTTNGTATDGNNGRAPPPAWMEERDEPFKSEQRGEKQEEESKSHVDSGEADMTLDESDDENSHNQHNNNKLIQPNQNQYFQQQSNDFPNHQQQQHQQYQAQQQQQQQQAQTHNQNQNQNTNYPQSQAMPLTLDTFPIHTFNPTLPESWSNLAQAWKNSMGRDPNQMELMAFLAGGAGMGMNGENAQQ